MVMDSTSAPDTYTGSTTTTNSTTDTRTATTGSSLENPPLPPNDRTRYSLDQPPPPPYSLRAGNRGSTVITSTLSTAAEEHLFQVQELARQCPTSSGNSSISFSSANNQPALVCADTMHDQQYLLVGSANALHSIDLTLPQDRQLFKTHIQGVAFKEIHCLEDLGLVVAIAGRNSRVRCYDYEAIKRLVAYGYSKEGQGRVVEGGKLGSMKNMIQLRVETALSKDEQAAGDSNGPAHGSSSSRRHRQSGSIDRTLLSPLRAESPSSGPGHGSGSGTEDERDPLGIRSKQQPMSFVGLASLAHEHKKNKQPQATPNVSGPSTTTQTAGGGGTPTKTKRLSQMASYLSNAAANSTMAAQILNSQDSPSEEAVSWAWSFTKVKQTKDAMALDFHYTPSTVYMTVLSKTGIDIYSRPKAVWGRRGPAWLLSRSNGPHPGLRTREGPIVEGSGAETPGRPSTSSLGGMVSSSAPIIVPADNEQQLEWKQYKQFYHPEAPSFMTVVKNTQEISDIILGKGPRACVINVADMSVTDLHRQEGGSVMQGFGKKLGFRSSLLWHSFETIPFDVPAHILFPAAVEAIYGRRDEKNSSSNGGRFGQQQQERGGSNNGDVYTHHRASTLDTIQLPSEYPTHRTEAPQALRSTPLEMNSSSSPSSNSSSPDAEHRTTTASREGQRTSHDGTIRRAAKTRMVTSDQVLSTAFSRCATTQLFLATYGSQSRIVDLCGKPQSPIVLDWGSFPPQSVEFLKTSHDIYVVGFEKTSITVFSLTRAKKIKEILKRDLVQSSAGLGLGTTGGLPAAATGDYPPSRSLATSPPPPPTLAQSPPSASSLSSTSIASSLSSAATTAIKYLGRDNVAEDSMGLFFSYLHPKNGTSICKLAIAPFTQDEQPPHAVEYYDP